MNLIDIALALLGVLAVSAIIVSAAGLLSFWIGRYQALKELDVSFQPGREQWVKEWADRMARAHGVFALQSLRDQLDAHIARVHNEGYPDDWTEPTPPELNKEGDHEK